MCDLSGKIESGIKPVSIRLFRGKNPVFSTVCGLHNLFPLRRTRSVTLVLAGPTAIFTAFYTRFYHHYLNPTSKVLSKVLSAVVSRKTNLNFFGLISFSRHLTFSRLFSIYGALKSVVRTSIISHFLIRQKSNFFSILAAV